MHVYIYIYIYHHHRRVTATAATTKPIRTRLDKVDTKQGMVFLAPANKAEKAVRLCGTPTVTLAAETAGTNASIFTVIAYLYDVDPPK